jgi:DNA-binding NarL/FixJ family response regulator
VSIKKIVIVDDNQGFIDAIKMLLHSKSELQVVGEANNANDFYDIMKKIEADLVLMDINMPVVSGLTAGYEFLKNNKNIKILGLTMSDDYNIHSDMMRIGFAGGILKNNFSKNFNIALNKINNGEHFFPLIDE